ncbi:Protein STRICTOSIDINE SYNTHASE-LIKE 10 [Linum grandiflorum]
MEPKCGRPLGLKFNPVTCDLYIADAYLGLLVVGPEGGVARKLVTTSPEGLPFRFLNALDIHSATGIVYFTDSSIYFQRRYLSNYYVGVELSMYCLSISN